jgi:hypothetical protein
MQDEVTMQSSNSSFERVEIFDYFGTKPKGMKILFRKILSAE